MGDTQRLLALDIDDDARRSAVEALKELFPQAEILEARSQTEAEASWRGPAPDLVAIAFALDGQTGLDAALRIRKLAPKAQLVVYAAALPESARRALAEIGCAMVSAPLTAERLVAALDCCAAEKALVCRSATAQAYA